MIRADYETAAQTDDKVELGVWLRLLTCAKLIERGYGRT
jgi:hypothetical protein